MQLRISKLVGTLASRKGIRLDPGPPTFFGGSMDLPQPGVPWEITLRSRGKSQTIVLPADQLGAFKAGRSSTVRSEISAALDDFFA